MSVNPELRSLDIDIPAQPQALVQLSLLLADDDINLQAAASLIEGDMALAAAVMKAVNSSLYGLKGRVQSVQQAITYLGMREVAAITFELGLRAAFPPALELEPLWQRAADVYKRQTVAATAAAVTAAATATAATTEAARPLFAGTRFVDHHGTAVDGLAVHAVDGGLSFRVRAHFHEAEALGTTGFTVHHDLGRCHGAKGRKGLEQRIVAHRVGQITDVQFVTHGEPSKDPEKPCGAQPCVNRSSERCGCQTQTTYYGVGCALPAKRGRVKCCFVAPGVNPRPTAPAALRQLAPKPM